MTQSNVPTSGQALSYPESDGKPMGESTLQYRWIVFICENVALIFHEDALVFVAADLFWYPVEGDLQIYTAPDTMVVFGVTKGDRSSYQQWLEKGIPPQVVFEIRSPSNTPQELRFKRGFYERFGVEEYYLYDPVARRLRGWLRQGERLVELAQMSGWESPRLGVRFEIAPGYELRLRRPDGRYFESVQEINDRAEQERQRAEQERLAKEQAQVQAEQERQRAEQERLAKEQAQGQAEQERQAKEQAQGQAEQERQAKEQERQRAERLAERLRALGINPEEL